MPEASEAPVTEPIDYTLDAAHSISFTKGYAVVIREAEIYENASISVAYAKIGRGVAYAVARANAGESNDRLKIAFATQEGVKTGYIAAENLRPMSMDEAASFVTVNRGASQFYYQEERDYPLAILSIEPVVADEPTPEPSDEPEINLTQRFGPIGVSQLMSVENIETQYSFDLYSDAAAHADVVIDLSDLQDVTFTGISGMTLDTDYTVLDTSVAILTGYLSSLAVGSHQFTMEFSDSQQVIVEITVVDTTPVFSVSPIRTVYNIKEGSPHYTDLTFTLAMDNTAFSGIVGMEAGSDYTVSDDTVTIPKETLGLLPLGENQLTFAFAPGGSIPVIVVVYDGANTGALTPSSAVFDHAAPGDITVGLQLSGCTFVGIEGLTEGNEYTFANDTVTLSQVYLKTLIPGPYDLTFTLDCGDNILFSLNVADTVPVVQLQPERTVYDKYEGSGPNHDAIHVRVLPMENPLAGITGLLTFPHADSIVIDPIEGIRKEVILSIPELDSLEVGEHTLYFVYEGPRFVPFTVTIMDSTPILYLDGVPASAGSGEGWSYADDLLQITQSGLTVSGGSDTASIQVAASVTNLTVYDLQLNSGNITIQSGSPDTLALTLTGTSNINGHVLSGGSLQINGDGSLDVTSTDGSAIKAGSITMQGGTVTVTGNNTQANVPGYGMHTTSGNIVVSGGTLTATGRSTNTNISYCSGIYANVSIIITGGTVTAICDDTVSGNGIDALGGGISISGGTVSATGNGSSDGYGFNSNYVTISGGLVTATGEGRDGIGIMSYGLVNITGGTVTAQGIGLWGKGIESNNDITISNSTVNASGISAGYSSVGIDALRNIRIDSGVVNAQGNSVGGTAYGLYAFKNCMINGGNVTANGTGYSAYGIHACEENVTVTGGWVTAIGSGSGNFGNGIVADLGAVYIDGGSVTSRGSGSNSGYGIDSYGSTNVSGTGTYLDVAGSTAAFSKTQITAYAQSKDVTGLNRVIFQSGQMIITYVLPTRLTIDGATYEKAQLGKDITGNGWAWKWEETTLTLQGYNGSAISASNIAPLQLILADGTENTVTSTSSRAIETGKLIISGNGSLTATGTGTGGSYGYGIYASDVTIQSGVVTAVGNATAGDSNNAYGIYAPASSVTISGGTVTAIANASDYGYGLKTSNLYIQGGSVTVSSSGLKSCNGILATGDITITGGSLVANISSSSGYPITAYDDLEVSGGTVTADGTYGIVTSDDITINGGVVTASGGYYGLNSSGSVSINGGTVIARGKFYGISALGIGIGGTAFVDSVGDSRAFDPAIINAGGQQADTTGWKYALYDGGVLRQAEGPSGLTIGGTTYGPSSLIMGISKTDWSWDWETKLLTLQGYNGGKISYNGPTLNLMLTEDTENSAVNDYGPGVSAPSIIVSGKGKLTVDGDGSYGYGLYATSGGITILDGEITADGYYGGLCSSSGDIIISGGTVEASARTNANAIYAHNGSVAIHGGNVTANARRGYSDSHGIKSYHGNFTMDGGTVNTSGECGVRTDGGDIVISGGTLTAEGYDPTGWSRGYGIHANTGNITIQDGVVVSNGTHRSIYTTAGDITINGGSVKAYGEGYRGLSTDSGNVYINHGTVLICVTSANAYGIHASSSIVISGSDTHMKVAASTAAFSKDTITVNGQPVNVSGMEQASYRNGAMSSISSLKIPFNLTIGGESHTAYELFESDISGDGWTWNCEASLLTLNGYEGGPIVSTGPAVLQISLENNTQNNVLNLEANGTAIRAASVEIGGSGSLAVHGSFAGIYADDRIAFVGTQARIRAWGMNALVASTKTANGTPVYMQESWNHALYENGSLKEIETPSRLDIGDLSYLQDDLFEDISGSGWAWDCETAQLTLRGCNVGYIQCLSGSSLQVVLEEGTHNIASGLWTGGSLYISGRGILIATALQAVGASSSIFVEHSVVLTEQYYASGLTVQGGLFFKGSNHIYTLEKDTVIQRNLVLPEGNRYIIPAGRRVTIAQGASLTVNGELVNNGTLTGNVISGSGNTTKISAISLNPSSKTVYVNQTFTPATTFTPGYAANKQVTWSSSNTAVATVSSAGLVTGKKAGTAVIRATAKDGSGVYGQCTVTVKQYVTQLTLSSTSVPVIPGKTVTLGITALPADASDKQVSWASSNTAVATVSSAGVVTGLRLGTATITATAKDGSGVKAICTVTVGQPAASVTLNLPKITIGVGQAVSTVTAGVLPANAIIKQVSWSSSNSTVAKVDVTGKITGVKTGTATITATAADGSRKAASVVVTVVSAGRGVTGIKLSLTSATVYVKKTLTLKATITPTSVSNSTVQWVSSNTAVATVSNGVVTGVAPGSATITAISSSGISARCTITVTDVPVSSVTLSKTSISILIGSAYQLTATVLPADAKNKTLTWTSSNVTIATVDTTGKVTAKALGTATITAKSNNGKTAACLVTVNPVKITALTLSPASTTISIGKGEVLGKKITLKANITPTNATIRTFNWTTTNSKVATVDQNGVVTSVGYGTAIIRATAKDGSGVYGQSTVTVKKYVTQLTLSRTSAPVIPGKTVTLGITVLPADAFDKQVSWASSNTAVATVSSAGVVTGLRLGTATITATAKDGSGVKAICTVTVGQPAASVTLNLPKITIGVGQAVSTVTAGVLPANAIIKQVSWSSSNSTVAKVDVTGKITGVKTGTATITATAADGSRKAASVVVTVVSAGRGVTGIKLSLTSATVYVKKTLTLKATLTPTSVSNPAVQWISSNKAAATVNNGVVTGVAPGSTTITAISSSGISVRCTITVTDVR